MEDITFHLLHNIEDQSIASKYEEFVKTKFNTKLLTYHISEKIEFRNSLQHVSNATMLRLFIPEVINKKSKILYLDIDVLVQSDLRNIFKLNVGSCGISGKSSLSRDVIKSMTFNNISTDYKTLNAGVLLMDLEKLRRNKFTEKCIEIVSQHPYIDQVIINLYLEGKYIDLPKQYNVFNNQDDYLLEDHDDYIFHYVGPAKPWNGSVQNKDLWAKFEQYI
jgi:lipopolysaccharide biosynthesis glycosyltransferase